MSKSAKEPASGRRVVLSPRIPNLWSRYLLRIAPLGNEGSNIGTYTSTNKPDGSLYGEGQGLFATSGGDFATWRGIGIGRLLPDGGVSYRGCISLSTSSAKLARLNTIAAIFEFDVDPDGNTRSKFWEWK